ncbi:hypothetical protein FISHEDRAFT_56964 [Fistulina hepatica ATCC 64428]|nr:hypothetical protein FISHEDRAFT_56964 [Fistulina hepatica ATCC 64428]
MPDPHFEVAVGIGNTAASVASSALNFAHSQVSSRKMLTIGSEEMKKGLAYVTEQRPTTELGPYVIDLPQRRRLGREFMELSQQREEILASTDSIASNVLFAQRDARYFKRRARRFHDIAKKSSEEARAQAAMKGSVSECSGGINCYSVFALCAQRTPDLHQSQVDTVSQPRGNTNPLPSAARIDGAQQPSVPAARSYHDASRVRPTEPPHPEPTDSLARAFQSQASVSGNPSQIPNTQALQESRYMYPTMPSSSAYYAPTSNAQYPGSSRQPNRAQYDGSAPRQQMYMASPTQGRVGPSAPETYVPPFPGNNRQPAAGGYTTGYTGRDTSGIGAQSVHVEPYQIQESGRRHGRTSHGTSYTTIPLPGRREASLVRPGPVQPQAARAADNFTTANVGRNDAERGLLASTTRMYLDVNVHAILRNVRTDIVSVSGTLLENLVVAKMPHQDTENVHAILRNVRIGTIHVSGTHLENIVVAKMPHQDTKSTVVPMTATTVAAIKLDVIIEVARGFESNGLFFIMPLTYARVPSLPSSVCTRQPAPRPNEHRSNYQIGKLSN